MTYLISALISVVTTLFLFIFQPWLKKWWTTQRLEVKVVPTKHGNHVNLKVINHSAFTMGQAGLFITINHRLEDLQGHTDNTRTFHEPGVNAAFIDDCQLCWSSRSPKGPTPANLDIFSGECQTFSPFQIYADRKVVEIPSEAGWLEDKPLPNAKQNVRHSRAFLTLQRYEGQIKVVSNDSFGKVYKFIFDPQSSDGLLKISHEGWWSWIKARTERSSSK